ncbi:MAG TPA: hypothetical protein VJ259_01080, partial [Actinomycetota bacterium]|nr:hypothetical protein [Actinomycetota bacterium]
MRRATVLFVFILISGGGAAIAYEPGTHERLAIRSAAPSVSLLDQILKQELGLIDGIKTPFPGTARRTLQRVEDLIGDGARFEDFPSWRALNHFHNPLVEPWDEAGLRTFSIFGLPLVRGQSSTLWQQNPNQPWTFVFTPVPLPSLGGQWSWQDARRRYLDALTRPGKEDTETEPGRDRAFGELFETLGHLTHLVQDAFVPAHARNDAHPPGLRSDWYEMWVERARTDLPGKFSALLNATPKGPAPSIFTATGNERAPVPVARLIDTDTFRPPSTSVLGDENSLIGAAEYSNGNFLSRGTLFRRFQFPRTEALDPRQPLELTPGKFRRYFTKSRDG